MSFSVNDIYTSMLGSSQSYQASSLSGAGSTSSLSNLAATTELQNTIENAQTDEELMEACKSFEQYFLEQVFKGMKATVETSEEEENAYTEMFGDMLIEEYAKSAVDAKGYGVAQMLYDSMKHNKIDK